MTVRFQTAESEQLPAAATTIYTCPTGFTAEVMFGNCANEDATDTTLEVNIVRSGGGVGVSNVYLPSKTITAGTSDPLDPIVGAILEAGDFISATAGAIDRLNFKLGIKEVSLPT